MENWSLSSLRKNAIERYGTDKRSIESITAYAHRLKSKNLPVVFSLGHLSKITGVDYHVLHQTVDRDRETANYKMFRISKRSGGFRYIHIVESKLARVQKYIHTEILKRVSPHPTSFAFHSEGGIYKCAARHCEARWLLQFDLENFFYDIDERRVFRVFENFGYRSILAFEMARLCTTTKLPKPILNHPRYRAKGIMRPRLFEKKTFYEDARPGVLPQGASTSPMLANFVARSLDETLDAYAMENSLVYTRYADDITFSAYELPERKSIGKLKREIVHIIRKYGFKENEKKFRVAGPGSRKRVLGLLVDGREPKLSKETRKRVDRLLYAVEKYGWDAVASHDGFGSTYGLQNHLCGLIAFTKDVDRGRWESYDKKFHSLLNKSQEGASPCHPLL